MTKLHILGVPALVLVMLAPDAMAQRRGGGGGAVSGGVRGAMVGGLVGGSEGAETGAKLARLPAPPEPPLIGKLKGVPNIKRALITRMLLARISTQHRHRCWPPPHRQRRRPHRLRLRQRLRRQRPAERPSFARMVSP